MPKVSICVPTYNRVGFMAERIESVVQQTYGDWEVIAADSGSQDGTLERLQDWALADSRVHVHTIPREGIYPAFNYCINAARGDYIYIAPSDDNMDSELLAKLVEGLESNPNCDIAHAPLRAVDLAGKPLPGRGWMSPLPGTFTDCLEKKHVRLAPLDGMLHLFGGCVYLSLTQLLFRRNLFSDFGGFSTAYRSFGDFHWMLNVTMRRNTVHIPNTWGGFRIHPDQATSHAMQQKSDAKARFEQIIDDVLSDIRSDPSMQETMKVAAALQCKIRLKRKLPTKFVPTSSSAKKCFILLQEMLKGNCESFDYLASKWTKKGFYTRNRAEALCKMLDEITKREHIVLE